MRTLTAVLVVAALSVAAPPAAHAAGSVDLSSNVGCSVDCIRTVLVHPSTNAVGIRASTDTPARIRVVLRKRATGALVADRSSALLRKTFVTFGGGLESDTLYSISVKATDSAGHVNERSGTFRTLDPQTIGDDTGIGDLASGAGCAAQCIRTAQVTAGLRAARMTVNTNTPARLLITASRDKPLATSQGPSFVDPEVETSADFGTTWSGELLGLVASERYHVIIRAIDANGRMAVRQGTFETAHRHAIVTIQRIRVSYDGDKGRNRGELSFFARINGHWRLERGEGKVKSNSTVHFPHGGSIGYTNLPRWMDVKVQGVERDTTGTCYDSMGPGPFSQKLSGSLKHRCHKRTWNTAIGEIDLDEVFAQDGLLPGFGGTAEFEKTFSTSRGGVRFSVDVGFEVWSAAE